MNEKRKEASHIVMSRGSNMNSPLKKYLLNMVIFPFSLEKNYNNKRVPLQIVWYNLRKIMTVLRSAI